MLVQHWIKCSNFFVNVDGERNGDTLATDMEAEMSSLNNRAAPRKSKYRRSAIRIFGVDLTPDNIAVAMVYFVQGVLGLSRLAVSFYLKDDLHLNPAEVCISLESLFFRLSS